MFVELQTLNEFLIPLIEFASFGTVVFFGFAISVLRLWNGE